MPRKLIALYAGLAALVAASLAISLTLGADEDPEPAVAGGYALDSSVPCLGRTFTIRQSGQFGNLSAGDVSAPIRIRDGHITGDVDCAGGGRRLNARVGDGKLSGTLGDSRLMARLTSGAPA